MNRTSILGKILGIFGISRDTVSESTTVDSAQMGVAENKKDAELLVDETPKSVRQVLTRITNEDIVVLEAISSYRLTSAEVATGNYMDWSTEPNVEDLQVLNRAAMQIFNIVETLEGQYPHIAKNIIRQLLPSTAVMSVTLEDFINTHETRTYDILANMPGVVSASLIEAIFEINETIYNYYETTIKK